jgi:DNA-binding NarL/FixJ family response regulator
MTAPVQQVGPSPSGGGPVRYLPRLNTRERQVLVLIANGHTNAAIGRRLVIAEQTVKTRVKGILRKLHVGDRAYASTVAVKLGLISLDEINLPEGL